MVILRDLLSNSGPRTIGKHAVYLVADQHDFSHGPLSILRNFRKSSWSAMISTIYKLVSTSGPITLPLLREGERTVDPGPEEEKEGSEKRIF